MGNSKLEPSRVHDVVFIEGDGIGPELVESATIVFRAVQNRFGTFDFNIDHHDAGAAIFRDHGYIISSQSLHAVKKADAVFKGPAGLPDVRQQDGTEAASLAGLLRRELSTYANVRPVRLFPNVPSPLKYKPGEVDYVIVRENMEGLYLSRGRGIGNSTAMTDTLMITREGTERIVRFAFDLARTRNGAPRDAARRVTCVDKSNVLASYAFFRRVFDSVKDEYPDVEADYLYADAAAQELVMHPDRFDVLVMENFLGDILSDLGGGTVGGIGLCPSGNIGFEHSYFEPIHGSAPDIASKDLANPIAQILSLAMMLDHLGEQPAGEVIRKAVWETLSNGSVALNTMSQPIGGTIRFSEAIAVCVAEI